MKIQLYLKFIFISMFLLAGCVKNPEPAGEKTTEIVWMSGMFCEGTKKAAENVFKNVDKFAKQCIPVDKDVLVNVKSYMSSIFVELKYAGNDNFTGQKIYEFQDAYLRYGTVEKLRKVQAALKEQGLSLKIWDAYRPVSAQFALWKVCPNSTYVANPNSGYSAHSRGNTIDVTLVDEQGEEIVMPTKFDDFSRKADRNYSDCEKEARENALLLEKVMYENGFRGYSGEWWHFTDIDSYLVETNFEPPR